MSEFLPQTYVPGFHDANVIKQMPYNPLGDTGLYVSKLALGTGGFSVLYGEYSLEECKKTVHEAIKKGINFIDTAPFYGYGESEKVLGMCLEGIPRKAYYLATKVCRYEKDPKSMFDFSAQKTKQSIDISLARLKVDYVDLLQTHDIEFAPSLDIVVNETLPAVEEIVNSGKARHIGITGYPLSTLKECIQKSTTKIETVLTYCRGSMIDNTLDSFMPFLQEKRIGIINAAANAMGLLSSRGPQNWHPASDTIKKVCAKAADYCNKKGVELGKLAVYHSLQIEGTSTTLVGMNSPKLLNYNLDALHNGISQAEKEAYEEVKKILNELPPQAHWENVEVERFRSNSGLTY